MKTNYIPRKDLNTVTIKKGNQKLTYKISDVLNGAYKLESGAKIEDIAFYVPKRNIVKVQLKSGKDFKPTNGYWIKDTAKPIHTSKYDDGGSVNHFKVGDDVKIIKPFPNGDMTGKKVKIVEISENTGVIYILIDGKRQAVLSEYITKYDNGGAIGYANGGAFGEVAFIVTNNYFGNLELGFYNVSVNEQYNSYQAFMKYSDALNGLLNFLNSEDGEYMVKTNPKSKFEIEMVYYNPKLDKYKDFEPQRKIVFSLKASMVKDFFNKRIFDNGGAIPNNYKGKTAEEVWNLWTLKQREHFLADHYDVLSGQDLNSKNKDFDELQFITQAQLDLHIKQGQYYNGGTIESKIQKKVDEVNALIEKAVDSDGDPLMVVDTSGTWEEPMQYKPIVYKNGRLYIEYFEPYSGKTNKEVINKSNINFDGYPTLLNIAKMYRKALKKQGVSYAGGGFMSRLFKKNTEPREKYLNEKIDLNDDKQLRLKQTSTKRNLDEKDWMMKHNSSPEARIYSGGGEMSGLKIGQKYRTKNGDILTIVDFDIENHVTTNDGKGKLSSIAIQRISVFKDLINDGELVLLNEGGGKKTTIEEDELMKKNNIVLLQGSPTISGQILARKKALEEIEKSEKSGESDVYPSMLQNWKKTHKETIKKLEELKKYYYGGGKVTFKEKATAIAKKFEGKSVEPKYQKEYGKRYDKDEAREVGNKIAGSQKAKYDSKMSGGGSTKKGKGNHKMKEVTELAKKIRKDGEKWTDALKRAYSQMK